METESVVNYTPKVVQRFRILCVGTSGAGMSSLINRVLGLENSPDGASIWGYPDIEKELTSPENNYLVLHHSQRFKRGDTKAYNDVDRFIRQRRDPNCPLKDQLHAVWLCTVTPIYGERVLERIGEWLLRLAHETRIPVVLVFTKYDRLVWTMRWELQNEDSSLFGDVLCERSKEKAREALDECIRSLERTSRATNTPMPHYVNVSIQQGYEASISSLVQVTCNLDSFQLESKWIAQRASDSREVKIFKINASVNIAIATMGRGRLHRAPGVRPMPLHDCLGIIHQDIVTCWDFRDEEKTLSSDGFKQLMLYLVQEVQESQNQDGPYVLPPLEVDKISTFLSLITAPTASFPLATAVIGLTCPFVDWLCSAVLDNGPSVQRLLMAYTTYLVTVLKSLFDIVESSPSEGTMWLMMKRVFRAYGWLDPREQLLRRIWANFQHDGLIGDPVGFRRALCALLEHEPPRSGSECDETVGWNAQDTGVSPASFQSTGEPLGVTAPSLGVPILPPGVVHVPSPVVSAQWSGGPAPSPGVPAPSPAGGGHEESDIHYKALERKYRKQPNNRRTHAPKSSVPSPEWDLPDTDSDSTVENDDRHENFEERFFHVDSGSYNAPRSIKTMSKRSFSTYSLVSTPNSGTSTIVYPGLPVVP